MIPRWLRRRRMPAEHVAVFTASDRGSIILARSLLESAGIAHVVNGDAEQDLFGWGRIGTGFSFVTGPARVLVARGDADLAKELLAGLQSSTPPGIPLWMRIVAIIILGQPIVLWVLHQMI